MDLSAHKPIVLKIAFGLMMIGVVYMIMQYYKKDIPREIRIVHIFGKDLTDQNAKIKMEIFSGKKLVLNGEYRVNGKRFTQVIKLPESRYSGNFEIFYSKNNKKLSIDLLPGENSYTVRYKLHEHNIEH